MTQGPATTVINVTGGQFLPNQQMTLYWDSPNKVAGSATADANGSFNTRVKPNVNDKPGVHKLCASGSTACANFTLLTPPPSPSPTPAESPSPSPSPEPSPSEQPTPGLVATPARGNSNLSGFDVISRPPFVFLPIFGIGALLLALGYWAISALRKPRRLAPIPSAAVVHRATRPDYSAAFGTPPPRQPDASQQSAWSELMPPEAPRPAAPPPALPSYSPPAPAPQAAPPRLPAPGPEPEAPAYEWGLGEPDTGYPDLRKRLLEEGPEPPPPTD